MENLVGSCLGERKKFTAIKNRNLRFVQKFSTSDLFFCSYFLQVSFFFLIPRTTGTYTLESGNRRVLSINMAVEECHWYGSSLI